MRIKCNLYLVFSLLISIQGPLISCPDETGDLTLIATLPNDTDAVYIGMTLDFCVDNQKHIWICDQSSHKIHQFSQSFNFIRSIGDTPGQGPGEFMSPTFVTVEDDELFVIDIPNRVQILNKEGEYKTSFTKGTSGHGLVKCYDKILIAGIDKDSNTTMNVCDRNGTVVKQLGSFIKGTEDLNPLLNLGRVNICDDKIYYSFMYYPEIHVYDVGYNFVKSINFHNKKYKKLISENVKFNKIKKSQSQMEGCKLLFVASTVNELGIFFIVRGKDILIDHYDHDGKLLMQYAYPECEFAVTDMHVCGENNGDIWFYLLGAEIHDYVPEVKVFKFRNTEK